MHVLDPPGFQNPASVGKTEGALFDDLCHNYEYERLQKFFHDTVFTAQMERYSQVLLIIVMYTGTFCLENLSTNLQLVGECRKCRVSTMNREHKNGKGANAGDCSLPLHFSFYFSLVIICTASHWYCRCCARLTRVGVANSKLQCSQ